MKKGEEVMRISLRTVTALCGSFALILLYLVFVLRFVVLADWSSLSRIELLDLRHDANQNNRSCSAGQEI